jgi:hypothetical protein
VLALPAVVLGAAEPVDVGVVPPATMVPVVAAVD